MAVICKDTQLQLQTTKNGDLESVTLQEGEAIRIIHEWDRFYLIKDQRGHYYNVAKDAVKTS